MHSALSALSPEERDHVTAALAHCLDEIQRVIAPQIREHGLRLRKRRPSALYSRPYILFGPLIVLNRNLAARHGYSRLCKSGPQLYCLFVLLYRVPALAAIAQQLAFLKTNCRFVGRRALSHL